MGLNIDQAINGSTKADRKAGVVGAIASGIDTLFNLPFLRGASELAEVGEASETFSTQEKTSPNLSLEEHSRASRRSPSSPPARPMREQGADLLSSFETNEMLDGLSPVAQEGQVSGDLSAAKRRALCADQRQLLPRALHQRTENLGRSLTRPIPIRFIATCRFAWMRRANGSLSTARACSVAASSIGCGRGAVPATPLPDIDSPPTAYDMPQASREALNEHRSRGRHQIRPQRLHGQPAQA